LEQWEVVNQDVHKVNGDKARILATAQWCLILSICVVVGLLFIATYYK